MHECFFAALKKPSPQKQPFYPFPPPPAHKKGVLPTKRVYLGPFSGSEIPRFGLKPPIIQYLKKSDLKFVIFLQPDLILTPLITKISLD
jgi:hypothetical protein